MQKNSMFKHILVAAAVCLLAAFFARQLTGRCFAPSRDRNLACYLQLGSAVQSKDYAVLKAAADQVRKTATDKQLQDLAAFYFEKAALAMDAGLRTFQEGESIAGFLRGARLGVLRPDKGLDAIGLLVKEWVIDPANLAKQVEARYHWVFAASVKADRYSTTAFWLTLVASGLLAWQIIQHEHGRGVKTQAPVVDTASAGSPPQPVDALECPLVQCPGCGARNPSPSLKSGQKLVCGNCKIVLASAG